MCNCNGGNVGFNNATKPATKSTEIHYGNVAKNKAYMSHEVATPNAKKGLLVDASNFKIDGVFDLTSYKFLQKPSGNEGQTVHPALWEHAKLNMNVGLYRVNKIEENESTDTSARKNNTKFKASIGDVFQVRGYDLANMTLVRGETGWIIMDVLTCNETAKAAFDFIKNKLDVNGGSHTIKGVFYSHSHVDHYGGIGGIINEENVVRKYGNDGKPVDSKTTQIIAPEGFMHYAVSENIFAGNAMNSRAAYMYGALLNPPGAQSQVDNGLGKATAIGTNSLIAPSKEIGFSDYKDGNRFVECMIDGITFQCQITPGTEAPAEMNVYMPKYGVMFIAENCTGTLHNLYTLRGAEVRDSMAWADYIDETIAVFPDIDIICSSHNWPHFKKEDVMRYLGLQRDVYRYMTNATLNLINKGYTIDEVGRMLEANVPDNIRNEWCNHGFYGTFNHNAKAIYQKYLGWYDSNPSNLNKMMPEDTATRYVQCMGGAKAVVEMAETAFNAGEYAWVAELLNRVVFARLTAEEEKHRANAKLLCADALEQLGYQSESGPWRNEYLTAAKVLRNTTPPQIAQVDNSFTINPTTVNAMDMGMIMQFLAITLNGSAAAAQNFGINVDVIFTAPTTNTVVEEGRLWIANGVLNFRKKGEREYSNLPIIEGSVTGDKLNFYKAFAEMDEDAFGKLLFSGSAKEKMKTLLPYLERFEKNFPIVTPRTSPVQHLDPTTKQLIMDCTNLVERYHDEMVRLGKDMTSRKSRFQPADRFLWLDFHALLVKTRIIEDGGFFTNKPLDPNYGISLGDNFSKTEYSHFLYRCYQQLAGHLTVRVGYVWDCINMLEPYAEGFRGKGLEGKLTTLQGGDKEKWLEIYRPKLVYPYGKDKILDDLFYFPNKDMPSWGIGDDGIFQTCEVCNVLKQLYQIVLGIKIIRSEVAE